jgi:hypothetical protein
MSGAGIHISKKLAYVATHSFQIDSITYGTFQDAYHLERLIKAGGTAFKFV